MAMKRRNFRENKGRVPNNAARKPKNSGQGSNMTPAERHSQLVELAAQSILSLNKEQLKKRIMGFKGRFKLDFTDEYLNNASPDRLRHILLGALITGGKSRRKKS
jgi:hypothetical protein